ncbi:MAG: ParB/RepB/Spo0J family partition protein, partial [Desulfovibrionaceae bacterium]|nr:ParB/RepB/Spo0J family partition protein [Desulfovibrionaceae bacterium]
EVPVYMRELTDNDVMLIALMENLQREDLNPAEEAMALQELKDRLSLTQEELASRIGKSRSQIANSLRLLQLPAKALASLQAGEITAGHARCLLGFNDSPEQTDHFLSYILEHRLSVRSCEDILAAWKKDGTLPWTNAESAADRTKVRHLKSSAFRRIEDEFARSLSFKAKLSGTSDSGRLTFIYKSEDELRRLLGTFGMDTAVNPSPAASEPSSAPDAQENM